MSDTIVKYFETTSKCNYKCPICVERTRNEHMKMSDFFELVDKNWHLFNKKGVWVDFNGEPLVDPHFFERVKYLKSKGLKVRMSTNGSLLHETNRHALAMSGIDYIVVSVATLDRETYKKIRGIDNLPLILSNLLELKKDLKRFKVSTELQAVMIDTCDGFDRNEFIKYFHDMGIHVAFHNFTNRAKSIKMNLSVENNHDYSLKRSVCKGLRSNIGILSNCDVVTCCCDFNGRNSLGNLRDYDYSVEILLNNGKLDEIENNLKNHIYLGACAECSDWIYYQKDSTEKYVTVYPVK